MDAHDIFKSLTLGIKFDRKQFQNGSEKSKVNIWKINNNDNTYK